jgi:hypothetical protein
MLCRYHHRLKTHAPGWTMTGAGDDDVVWITPSGRQARTAPLSRPTPGTDPEDDPPPF